LKSRQPFDIKENINQVGGSSRFWSGMMVFWAFPKQISTLKRENLTENWQMGMRNWFQSQSRSSAGMGGIPHMVYQL